MQLILQGMFLLLLSFPIHAQDFFIPEQFQQGQTIEQIILISDVDGVVRDSVENTADLRVIQRVKSLLENSGVDVAFLSGTPIENNRNVESWCQGNIPLSEVFDSLFEKELLDKRVAIYGLLGGHCMKPDGSLEVVEEYSPEVSNEIGKLLIQGFLKEVLMDGSSEQKRIATELEIELEALILDHSKQSRNVTSQEFYTIVKVIRQHLDPNFRLLSNGALIETHTSNPVWNTEMTLNWFKDEINCPQYLISHLPSTQKQIARGTAKRGEDKFNYFLICITNKGLTAKKHIEKKLKNSPNALVVTIGDGQVDFPMHKNAHLAFHVGPEEVWINNPLPHCVMMLSPDGKDNQCVNGTLQVLDLLREGMGKSFNDLKYIPRCDLNGQWKYYSINEIQAQHLLESL